MEKKKINEIVCIGTSFTEGDGLNPDNDTHKAPEWYLKNKNVKVTMHDYCWPTVLKKLTNVPVTNLGKSGSGIEYLMRHVEEILEKQDCKNTLFILEYSNWGRSELWCHMFNSWVVANWGPADGKDTRNGYATMISTDYNFGQQLPKVYFSVYESFLDNFLNEKEYLLQRDRNFLNLLYKLEKENISYQIVLLDTPFSKTLEDSELFNYKELLDESMYNYLNSRKLTIRYETNEEVMNGHPGIEGHAHLANVFCNKLKEKYTIG